MKLYFSVKAILPTNIRGGIRKIEVELMPTYMSYLDFVSNKDNGIIVTSEQGYEVGYDENKAKELFYEVFSNAIDFEYLLFFKKDEKTGQLKQIENYMF